ncbi:spirocyclase AveC family protein [Mycobacterium arosiense]|uniref:DUF5135 domain-containing protein n=1 Tax=Mycobacterium arosiense ATCC BAA-1401 = DSM 45069 TaxID=1265311 RepID=A0A1W9ZD16_MYCAI|nr:spirocyclase AveC family protein [Mycobacterium arosiense]ORA11669.1 hypothetical protein BST14_18320 [Mycobacterium arosiense ATCC BAA-1401 = DSM 45069]
MSSSVMQEAVNARQVSGGRRVLIWASLGLLQVLFAAYCVTRWYASGEMSPTPPGPDAMSLPNIVVMWVLQVIGPGVAVWAIWYFVAKPWRRDGRPSGDGMLLIACFLIAIPHDILLTYTKPSFSYNSHYVNAGSWLSQVPGIGTPNAHRIPEPLLLVLPGYAWALFLWAILGCVVMRAVRRRWPVMPYVGLLAITYISLLAIDVVFETALVRFRVMAFTGAVHHFTLWAGTTYQLPIHEVLCWVAFLTAMTAIRYSRDERGLTFVEQGVDSLRLPTAYRLGLRQLALLGVCTVAITLFYNLPWQLVSAHDDSFPANMPSYMLNGVCAPPATVATPQLPPCPGHHG